MVKSKEDSNKNKLTRKKITSKRILKKSQVSYKIPKRKEYSILGDQNRFFKDEMEDIEMSMFLRWYSHVKWFI